MTQQATSPEAYAANLSTQLRKGFLAYCVLKVCSTEPVYTSDIITKLRGTELVVVDPPRPGLHARAINTLLAVAAPTLIYVSCNPATLARDLKLLIHGGYRLEAVQPFDLFPHTFHIETVALLRR